MKWQFALVQLDNIIVYSKFVTEHLIHVRIVLALLRNAVVLLKFPKCFSFDSAVSNLGYKIRPGKLAINNKNYKATCKSLSPTSQTELRSLIRMCNV